MAEAADERDGLEPPSVATGRVVLVVAAVFALLALSFAVILAFTALRVHGSTIARARSFSAPALETNVAPRMVADRDHGPKPYRELPADERPARLGDADPRLAEAERTVAARGAQAYDPLPAAPTR